MNSHDDNNNPLVQGNAYLVNVNDQALPVMIMGKLERAKVNGVASTVLQIPSDDNDHTAVCTATIQTSTGYSSNFGVATPDMVGGTKHPAQLLHAAECLALTKALATLSTAKAESPTFDVACTTKQPASPPQSPQYKHRNDKPMSANQASLLRNLAAKKMMSIDQAAGMRQKTFAELTSADAHAIIQQFKNV